MDVGCSNGSFLKYISEKFLKNIGTDINSNLLKLAKKENKSAKFITMILQGIQKKKSKRILFTQQEY